MLLTYVLERTIVCIINKMIYPEHRLLPWIWLRQEQPRCGWLPCSVKQPEFFQQFVTTFIDEVT
jgi:hypothetical protein